MSDHLSSHEKVFLLCLSYVNGIFAFLIDINLAKSEILLGTQIHYNPVLV